MIEEAIRFGKDTHLVGVLSRPNHINTNRPAILLISAGLIHKAGPHRMHTLLAHQLVSVGYCVLRFDLNGIGDSRRSHAECGVNERSVLDIVSAMDFLERYNITGFVLGGLCSGAEDAFQTAHRDNRVKGIFMIDPHGYKTTGYYWRNFLFRVKRKTKWMIFSDIFNKEKSSRQSQELDELIAFRDYYPRHQVVEMLNTMLTRGLCVQYIYTGGVVNYFNYKRQFFDMFPELKSTQHVQVDYFPELDHTAIVEKDRNKIMGSIKHWVIANF